MDKVRVQRDLVYDPGSGLRLDAYAPPRSGRYPVVVLLHGGVPDDVPVRPKDWGLYRSWGKLLAASGFATVIPNQRISFPDPRLVRQSEPHRQHLSPAQLDQFSPLVQMERSGPRMAPVFVARAGNDEVPTLRSALDQFVSSALAHDAPLQLVNVPGIEHGFEIDDDPRVRETLRSLLRFLAEHLERR